MASLMASTIQAIGWVVTAGTAVYSRTGRIQQHREWMIRSYPFAAVFVVVRVIGGIPAIERMGLIGVGTVVCGRPLSTTLFSFCGNLQRWRARRVGDGTAALDAGSEDRVDGADGRAAAIAGAEIRKRGGKNRSRDIAQNVEWRHW
jgi:hypothetical protein